MTDRLDEAGRRYDEAVENAREAIEELKLASYALGYEDAQKDAKLREISETILTPEKLAKLDQKKRDEIVAKAKADVDQLKRKEPHEFIVNKSKRTIVALVCDLMNGAVYDRGIAKCDPSDCFNVHIGKAIALRRALGLDLPTYYLNVPNPTEVRVGDVVDTYLGSGQHHSIITVSGFWCGDTNQLTEYGKSGYTPFQPHYGDRIIDDSRE